MILRHNILSILPKKKFILTSRQAQSDHHLHARPTGTQPKMPIYRATPMTSRASATMHASTQPLMQTPTPTLQIPNAPSAVSLAQGTGSNLTVTWTGPAIDGTHGAASGFNLQSSPSGAATWTPLSGVTSPYNLSGLAANAAID